MPDIGQPTLRGGTRFFGMSLAHVVALPLLASATRLHAPSVAHVIGQPTLRGGTRLFPPSMAPTVRMPAPGTRANPVRTRLFPPSLLGGTVLGGGVEDEGQFPEGLVKFKPYARGPDPIQPMGGVGGLALYIPADEPLSSGPPPIAPALLRSMTVPHSRRLGGVVSGQTASLALDLVPRPRWTVSWIGWEFAERNQILVFLRDTCRSGLFGFDVEVDGPGTGAVMVRALEEARDSWETQAAYRIDVEVEEVFG